MLHWSYAKVEGSNPSGYVILWIIFSWLIHCTDILLGVYDAFVSFLSFFCRRIGLSEMWVWCMCTVQVSMWTLGIFRWWGEMSLWYPFLITVVLTVIIFEMKIEHHCSRILGTWWQETSWRRSERDSKRLIFMTHEATQHGWPYVPGPMAFEGHVCTGCTTKSTPLRFCLHHQITADSSVVLEISLTPSLIHRIVSSMRP